MAGHAAGLVFELLARDHASPAFLKVAGAADKAATATARAEKRIAGSAAAMSRTGAKLTKGLTLPLVGLAAVATDQAVKYEKSLNTIRVATDQSVGSMKLAHSGLLSLSKQTATSTDALSESLYTAAKSGQPMAKALLTVRAAAQGAKAENADLGVVTNALTSIMASYGSKLSDPVSAMNMIVRGAGQAKTTIGDFAQSLSNVVPVAASLGVGFDQVAGAIDTMSQHGESAQHATDNLRNFITNLAGQNAVASASLQQLGVNTVDLSRNLGKRGLTGSLELVLNAVAKNSKDGMVVTSAFRQAATATASLRTEIEAMPKSMQANAKAFDEGRMSYKDFYAYAKSLGGTGFALAKQFLATEGTAKGFNRQLVSGNSTTRTLAATLQKALGGVTGMNVALQLSGESAGKFRTYVKDVGDAAKGSGKDVLGFAETQRTASFKADRAKASLHALTIQAGDSLLPVFTKLADGATGVLRGFDGLSSGTKKFLGYAALLGIVLGPALSIFGKLARLQAGLVAAVTRSGGAIVGGARASSTALALQSVQAQQTAAAFAEAEALKAEAAAVGARAIATSLAGTNSMLARDALAAARDAEGFALAQRSRADAAIASAAKVTAAYEEQAAAARGATVAAAGGAGRGGMPLVVGGRGGGRAGGFMAGGGTMLAGFGGGLGLQYAGGKVGGPAGGVLSSAGTGMMIGSFFGPQGIAIGAGAGAAYGGVKTLFNGDPRIQQGGTVEAGPTLTEAGNGRSYVKNTKALQAFTRAELEAGHAGSALAKQMAAAAVAQDGLGRVTGKLGLTSKDLTNAVTGSRLQFRQVDNILRAMGPEYADQAKLLEGLRRAYLNSGKAAERQAAASGAVLSGFNRTTTAEKLLTGAHYRMGNAADLLTKRQLRLGGAAAVVRAAHTAFTHSLGDVSAAVAKNGKTLDADTLFGRKNRVAIEQAAAASLRHAQAVTKRTGSVQKGVEALQSDRAALIKTAVQSGLSAKAAAAVADAVFSIPKDHKSKITVNTKAARSQINDVKTQLALLRDKSIDITTYVRNVILPDLDTRNNGVSGEHSGPGGRPSGSSSHPRMVTDPTSPPRRARRSAAAQASGSASPDTKDAGAPAKSAADRKAAKDKAAQDAKDRADARAAARASAASLRQVGSSAKSSADDLANAGKDFIAAGKAAGLTKAQLDGLRGSAAQLTALGRKRDSIEARLGSRPAAPTAYDRLATAKDNYRTAKSTVRSAFTSSFDITSTDTMYGEPVTLAGIMRRLRKAVADAKTFKNILKRLDREGLSKVLIQQLADAGPAALPAARALLAATPKQLAAINRGYRSLGRYGGQAGKQVADDMYGAGVQSAQGLVNGLLSQERSLNRAIRRLARGMVSTLRHELDMHSPSRRLFNEGALAFEGYRAGIESMQRPVEKAARGIGNASIPGNGGAAAPGGYASSPTIGELHLHYSAADDYHRATATAMRAATTVLK